MVELAGAGVNAALALQTKANEVNPPVPIRLASLILTIGDPPADCIPPLFTPPALFNARLT